MPYGVMRDEAALRAAVEGAVSMSEVLSRLGLRVAGGNFASLRAACERYGLDLPYMDRSTCADITNTKRRLPLEDLLVAGRPCNSARLKDRLLEAGLLENKCAVCGLGPKWNGLPLVLQLDHINGDHDDNRLENLRLLCPNCHTQTENYAGRSVAIDKVRLPGTPGRGKPPTVEVTDDMLRAAVPRVYSWNGLRTALGKGSTAANYAMLRDRVQKLGLSTDHFVGRGSKKNIRQATRAVDAA